MRMAVKEGAGLGLYLTQEIVTRQRGDVSVKSAAEEGSELPCEMWHGR